MEKSQIGPYTGSVDAHQNQIERIAVNDKFAYALLLRRESLLRRAFGKIRDAAEVADVGAVISAFNCVTSSSWFAGWRVRAC